MSETSAQSHHPSAGAFAPRGLRPADGIACPAFYRLTAGRWPALLGLWLAWLGTTGVSWADEPSQLPTFVDVTQEAGIDFCQRFGDDDLSNIVEGTGSGCMFFDYDNDGWLDIYLLSGSWTKEVNDNRSRKKYRDKLRNRLYRNNRDGTFQDVTDQAGVGDASYSVGCSAADFDQDGDLDLYVLNYGPNVFYRNEGDGTFVDISASSGLDNANWSLSAPWFDYDGDGDLDVYVVNYLQYDGGKFRAFYAAAGYPGPLSYAGQPDALYRNNGDGTFTDVTKEAGVFNPNGRGMSGTVMDLDNDGTLDIYVSNDAMGNYFYRGLGNGKFEDDGLIRGLEFGEGGQGVSSMGPTAGDIDRDGWLDIYIPDMGYGCLLMNQEGFFDDHTTRSKLAVVCGQYTGWGAALFDYDNDGYLDIFLTTGNAHHEFPEEDVLLRNTGEGHFVDVARRSGDYFYRKHVGRGATYGDFDNDGDLDLLIANLNDPPVLLRNDGGNRNHWLKVVAKLANGKTDAIGARVTVKYGQRTCISDIIPVTGYLSQADVRPNFGLGQAKTVDMVEIRWPDGSRTQRKNVAANQVLTIVQPAE